MKTGKVYLKSFHIRLFKMYPEFQYSLILQGADDVFIIIIDKYDARKIISLFESDGYRSEGKHDIHRIFRAKK